MKETIKDQMCMMGYVWSVVDPDWKIRTAEACTVDPLIALVTVYSAVKGNKAGYIAGAAALLIHLGSTYIMRKAEDVYYDEMWKKEVERLKKEGKII